MTCTHRCQWCDGDYPCTTTEEVREGVYRCACASTDACHGCREHGACEECGERSAAGADEHPSLCAECLKTWLDNYDGPEPDYGAVTLQEQYDAAARVKREQR